MSILGLFLLIADIWAIYQVLQSGADKVAKLLWAVLIVALPLFGLLIWYLLGPKAGE